MARWVGEQTASSGPLKCFWHKYNFTKSTYKPQCDSYHRLENKTKQPSNHGDGRVVCHEVSFIAVGLVRGE